MGQKNKKNNNGEQQNNGGTENNKKKENGGGNTTVVLKADLHCEGCASKVLKCIRSFDGVETASIGEDSKITVVGKVDPAKLREKVEAKTHKKVELVSPQPKKDNNNNNNGDNNKKENTKGKENNNGGDNNNNNKQEKKNENKDKNNSKKNKSDEKKSKEKEIPVTTAVLKVPFHCEGCIQKIHKIVTKTKGYKDIKMDKQKELVTVTGTIDMKALSEVLKKHLKRTVEIIPAKKDGEKKENGGGGDKGKAENGGKNGGGGGEKGKNGGGEGGGGGEKVEGNRMEFTGGHPNPFMYGSGYGGEDQVQYHYNPYAVDPFRANQMFSDENPNACSVM